MEDNEVGPVFYSSLFLFCLDIGNAVPLTNVKLALSTPLGVAVVATCVHRLGLLLQNGTPLTQVGF